jgi:hypothetical protein
MDAVERLATEQSNIDAWEEEDNLSHERNRNERRQRDWEKSVKKDMEKSLLPQPHVQRQSLTYREQGCYKYRRRTR